MFLEIRAGTVGDEAALFAGDLFRNVLPSMRNKTGFEKSWMLPKRASAATRK
ncbi:MAG: hypothetical protein U0361_17620 [Nitrospiraceae bacterium]